MNKWEHTEEKISYSFSIGAPAGNLQVSWHCCQARACLCSLASPASRSEGCRAGGKGDIGRLGVGLGGTVIMSGASPGNQILHWEGG